MNQIPQYQIFKTASVFRIGEIIPHGRGARLASTGLNPRADVEVDGSFVATHKPKLGDYFVQYANGYQTTISKETFDRDFRALGDPNDPNYNDEINEEHTMHVAKTAYQVHYDQRSGKYRNNRPMPTVTEMFDDPKNAKKAKKWIAAAQAVSITT